MTATPKEDDRSMATVSKSFMLNHGLSEVLDAYSASTGVSFTKIVTAALLNYLFNKLDEPEHMQRYGPDSTWMEVAWRLDRGDVSIDQVPMKIVDDLIGATEREIERDDGENVLHRKSLEEDLAEARKLRSMIRGQSEYVGDERKFLLGLIQNQLYLYTPRRYYGQLPDDVDPQPE